VPSHSHQAKPSGSYAINQSKFVHNPTRGRRYLPTCFPNMVGMLSAARLVLKFVKKSLFQSEVKWLSPLNVEAFRY